MKTSDRAARISLALAILALLLGNIVPGVLLADGFAPMAVRFIIAAIPFIVIPFVIGWLTPSLWGLAMFGTATWIFFAAILLVSAPPRSINDLLMRGPLFLPLLLSLVFALLGRFWGLRRLQGRV